MVSGGLVPRDSSLSAVGICTDRFETTSKEALLSHFSPKRRPGVILGGG
jgi:hypothetical protein